MCDIIELNGQFIAEHTLRLLEGHAVFLKVTGILTPVPFEIQPLHEIHNTYIVGILQDCSSSALTRKTDLLWNEYLYSLQTAVADENIVPKLQRRYYFSMTKALQELETFSVAERMQIACPSISLCRLFRVCAESESRRRLLGLPLLPRSGEVEDTTARIEAATNANRCKLGRSSTI